MVYFCEVFHTKPLFWRSSSNKVLLAPPVAVRKFFGYALDSAQRGEQHAAAKVLKWLRRNGEMNKRIVERIEVEASSGNVFVDLGLPDADRLQIKSGLTIEIAKAIRSRGFTQAEAAKRMGLTQPKVSSLLRGEFSNFSERKLMDCLNRLGYDIEIRMRETAEPVGHLVLTHT